MRLGSERGGPGGNVRSLPAGADARLGTALRVRPASPVGADDHVEQQVAEGAEAHAGIVACRATTLGSCRSEEQRLRRMRSFVLGGLVGASAVLATVRRRRASARSAQRRPGWPPSRTHRATARRWSASGRLAPSATAPRRPGSWPGCPRRRRSRVVRPGARRSPRTRGSEPASGSALASAGRGRRRRRAPRRRSKGPGARRSSDCGVLFRSPVSSTQTPRPSELADRSSASASFASARGMTVSGKRRSCSQAPRKTGL